MAQSRLMKLLNTAGAAESLGVSVRRVRQLIAEGKLSAYRIGRDYAIEEAALSAVTVYRRAGRPAKSANSESQKANPRGKKSG